MKQNQRKVRRTFSTSFKKEKVELIDRGSISVSELTALYEVSAAAVYKWKKKYSKLPPSERIVVEKISEETKNKELLSKIRDLEGVIGRKQLEIDYYKAALEVIKQNEGEDLLKKHKPK
jgi:transposase